MRHLSLSALLAILAGLLHYTAAIAAPADLDSSWSPPAGYFERVIGDPEFTLGTSFSTIGDARVALQPDGKVVACSHARNGANSDLFITRYNIDGSVDASFGSGGIVYIDVNGAASYDACSSIAVVAGRIVILALYIPGATTPSGSAGSAVIRLDLNGARDTAFGSNGIVLVPPSAGYSIIELAVKPDGSIVFGGQSFDGNIIYGRLNADGTPDSGLSPTGTILAQYASGVFVTGMSLASDGAAVIVGRYVAGSGGIYLIRIRADGRADPAFGIGGVVTTARTMGLTGRVFLQSDGSIVTTATNSAGDQFALARYRSDGQLDTAFGGAGTGFSGLYALAIRYSLRQADDRILVMGSVGKAGSFPADTADSIVMRLLPDGTPDATFGSGGTVVMNLSTTDLAAGAVVQPDGRIVIAGRAIRWNGSAGTLSLILARLQGTPVVPMVVEFYNADLDNFFITADVNEQAFVDSGAVGRWARTGNTFKPGGSSLVCRFTGNTNVNPATGGIYGPNSHFYTADAAECAGLKGAFDANAKSWRFESNDFATTPAADGQCASGLAPVYRAYNNGFVRGVDSNHRITSNLAAYQAQLAAGWKGEGVVMCAAP